MIPKRIRRAAEIMLGELQSQQLTVRKVKSRRTGSLIRSVEQSNPDWYQDFCAAYPSKRKDSDKWKEHKTSVKRQMTLKALRYIAAGSMGDNQDSNYQGEAYTTRLIPVIEKWIVEEKKRKKFEREQILKDVPF